LYTKLVFENVCALEARAVAALMGTKAKAPEKAFESGTFMAFPVVTRAEATRV
jgi:hypothetical protein